MRCLTEIPQNNAQIPIWSNCYTEPPYRFKQMQFNLTSIYLNTLAVPPFKHNSLASKLLDTRSKEMEITWHVIGSVWVRWYIISQL
jgi:hypothetical protein